MVAVQEILYPSLQSWHQLLRFALGASKRRMAVEMYAPMINVLANLFRGLSFIFGISAPPPEQDQRSFVYMWLGILAILTLFALGLFYAISHVHLLR